MLCGLVFISPCGYGLGWAGACIVVVHVPILDSSQQSRSIPSGCVSILYFIMAHLLGNT